MCNTFWSAKIVALVKPLNLEALQALLDKNSQPYMNALARVLENADKVSNYVEAASLINSSSDRATLSLLTEQDSNSDRTVKHLLSGAELDLDCQELQLGKSEQIKTTGDGREISDRELFWWLWRCLPEAVGNSLGAESALIPAENILPDASIWSNQSLTAALAGSLAGYPRDNVQFDETAKFPSHPHLAIFSFSPVQELIKASRKMRDFWAGSWLLHYLSARICWYIAQKYGADSFVYPSLFQQPLIDRWLRKEYPRFEHWIEEPKTNSILTAGFPNVIVAVLPQQEVAKAMQSARQNLLEEWANIADKIFKRVNYFMVDIGRNAEDDPRWHGWLKNQWQTYWAALPIGKQNLPLIYREISQDNFKSLSDDPESWSRKQNDACNLGRNRLFAEEEKDFVQKVEQNLGSTSINVGSWWAYTFDQLRFSLSSVKAARDWKLPTVFTKRSSVSGMGWAISLGFPNKDSEETRTNLGLFDGKEELNATEILKRGLHLVLPSFLGLEERRLNASYPDLCSGVAGWLRRNPDVRKYYQTVCRDITERFPWTRDPKNKNNPANFAWGIPLMDESGSEILSQRYNPRLLNGGWLIDDFPGKDDNNQKKEELKKLNDAIAKHFPPGNNPTDWYVLAAGDGDGLSKWLKGNNLLKYKKYLNESAIADLPEKVNTALEKLKDIQKRMGPSTHNALSRALLDFSNQLAPYLTEQRYAGRLIYSGGDDIFAYTNLWEWDNWLWDIRQCFRGADDPGNEFDNSGDYWKYKDNDEQKNSSLPKRPLFTMGRRATISFGIVIAHHSVPLAIALESLWEAEEEAKEHFVETDGKERPKNYKKDAVQTRVMFGNGNTLKATSKFDTFNKWHKLIEEFSQLDTKSNTTLPAFFEQAALVWSEHPAPDNKAIRVWVEAFCSRRDIFFNETERSHYAQLLNKYLSDLAGLTKPEDRDKEITNWLKLAAFVLRKRQISVRDLVVSR